MKTHLIVLAMCLMMMAGIVAAQTSPASGAAAQQPSVDPEVMKQIGEMRTGLVDALNKRDFDKVLTYLDKDIVVTWANAEVSHGPAEVKAYCERMMNGPGKIVETITTDPVVEGRKMYGNDVMISYGSLGDEFHLTDGSDFKLNSRFSSLLVKEDGKWLMKGFHSSANVFDNPIQGIVVKKVATWVGIGAGVAGLVIGFVLAKLVGRKAAKA